MRKNYTLDFNSSQIQGNTINAMQQSSLHDSTSKFSFEFCNYSSLIIQGKELTQQINPSVERSDNN